MGKINTVDIEDKLGKSIKELSSNLCRCGGKAYKTWQYEDGIGWICHRCLRKAMFYTVKRISPKIGRNAPCPCGSGKKYKKCCLERR